MYNVAWQPSPNYWSGRAGHKLTTIVIHHWGDPKNYQGYDAIKNVANYLCRSNGNSSAHWVVTGKGRRAIQLVSENNRAWHAGTTKNNPNHYSIGIECDPNATDEDFDVIAELIADIWVRHGKLALAKHKDFIATACPGRYSDQLARILREAEAWFAKKTGAIPTPPTPLVTHYTVQKGDSYWAIAKKLWGGSDATITTNMHKLQEWNGNARLFAGMSIWITPPVKTPSPTPTPAPDPEPTPVESEAPDEPEHPAELEKPTEPEQPKESDMNRKKKIVEKISSWILALIKGQITISEIGYSIIRTGVPIAWSWLFFICAERFEWLAFVPVDVQTEITAIIAGVVGTLWYALIRVLAKKWPRLEALLGASKAPSYLEKQ